MMELAYYLSILSPASDKVLLINNALVIASSSSTCTYTGTFTTMSELVPILLQITGSSCFSILVTTALVLLRRLTCSFPVLQTRVARRAHGPISKLIVYINTESSTIRGLLQPLVRPPLPFLAQLVERASARTSPSVSLLDGLTAISLTSPEEQTVQTTSTLWSFQTKPQSPRTRRAFGQVECATLDED